MMAPEPLDLTLFLNQEYFFNELEGLNGIPPPTPPTITPASLKNFIVDEEFVLPSEVEDHENQAGFVPPPLPPLTSASITQANGSVQVSIVDSNTWQGGSTTIAPTDMLMRNTSSSSPALSLSSQQCPTPPHSTPSSRCNTPPNNNTIHIVQNIAPKRNVGGRRPNREKGISPEEEERRQVRRERNKLAAARCRKRRMDHTQELEYETQGLEEKRSNLLLEIEQLTTARSDLEYALKAHQGCCRLELGSDQQESNKQCNKVTLDGVTVSIKSEPGAGESGNEPTVATSTVNSNKRVALGNPSRPRPTSLNVSSGTLISDIAGIPISTPSNGIYLNFDSLMEGGTGLTPLLPRNPLVPSCSSQQRNGTESTASTPDAVNNKQMLSL
uniref:Transcription factor kayak n=1 Tax=Cacopsylla melanoneura TaxID=428564 RepID=A0A8D8VQI4_9HEMI